MSYDAIVVGGGMAGLTGAAYLCRYGYRVLLCEKSGKTGGLVNTFWHRGYAFDAGIRAFENSGILFPMLKSLGIEIELVKNSVSIGIADRQTVLHSRDSLMDYGAMLAAVFPRSASDITQIVREIKKVTEYMDVLYGIDNPLFLDTMRDSEYLLKTLLPWLLKYQVNIRKASRLDKPVKIFLSQITENRSLIDMIAQHFFENTPTFFALSYFGLYLDYCYPKGGTGVLAKKMTDLILSSGGEIMTRTAVSRIDEAEKEIYTERGELFAYKKLIWAADQKMLYHSVYGRNTPKSDNQHRLVSQGSGGDSILSVFLGVNLGKEFFQNACGAHSFYTLSPEGISSLPSWEETAGQKEDLFEWTGKYLEYTTYEISIPSLRDPALAPEGKTGVIISTLMDYRLVASVSNAGLYEKFKEFCTDKIIEVLNASIFSGIHDRIEFSLCATPLTIERETGNAQGAITGWAFTNTVLPAEKRFRKITNSIKTPMEDIYQCGQWTFSPSGLPVSILTGKLAADAVRKTMKGMRQ